MAQAQQPHDHPSSARPVCTRFEPGHLAQACLVDAYARLVPLRRRARLPLLGAGSLHADAESRRAVSGRRALQEEGQRCS
jgi:hypothetical protein